MLEPSTGRRLRSSAIAVLVVLRPYLFLTPGLLILGGLLGAVLILLRYSFNGYESDGGCTTGGCWRATAVSSRTPTTTR